MMCYLHMQYAMAGDSPVGSHEPTTVIVSFMSIHLCAGLVRRFRLTSIGIGEYLGILVAAAVLFLPHARGDLLVPNHSS